MSPNRCCRKESTQGDPGPDWHHHRVLRWLRNGLVVLGLLITTGDASASDRIRVEEDDEGIRVVADGLLFTRYHHDSAERPYFSPILLDGTLQLTRGWPMDPGPHDAQDHRHHRGLWYAHGAVNGRDFWTEGQGNRIVQESIDLTGGSEGAFETTNLWIDADGIPVCRDRRWHRFLAIPGGVILDFVIEFEPVGSDLVLGDTKEGSMAIRLAPTIRVTGPAGQGQIRSSEGYLDGDAWGKRASWVDYSGPVDEQVVGVALFDHPANPRHPTWWHVRTYGLFAANPFGIHDFEMAPDGAGDMIVPIGETVRFRYRFVFHHGTPEAAEVPELYAAYASISEEYPYEKP